MDDIYIINTRYIGIFIYNLLYNPYNKILQLSKPEKYKFIFFYWFSNHTKINNLDYQFNYSNLVLDDLSKQLTEARKSLFIILFYMYL